MDKITLNLGQRDTWEAVQKGKLLARDFLELQMAIKLQTSVSLDDTRWCLSLAKYQSEDGYRLEDDFSRYRRIIKKWMEG